MKDDHGGTAREGGWERREALEGEEEEEDEYRGTARLAFRVSTLQLTTLPSSLLPQGTACIYSRKVEYLHSLVFQVSRPLQSP